MLLLALLKWMPFSLSLCTGLFSGLELFSSSVRRTSTSTSVTDRSVQSSVRSWADQHSRSAFAFGSQIADFRKLQISNFFLLLPWRDRKSQSLLLLPLVGTPQAQSVSVCRPWTVCCCLLFGFRVMGKLNTNLQVFEFPSCDFAPRLQFKSSSAPGSYARTSVLSVLLQ